MTRLVWTGIGAVVGALAAIPFLAAHHWIGLALPFVGAVGGALAGRHGCCWKGDKPIRAETRGRRARVASAVAFLILGPVVAGAIEVFVLGEPFGTPHFTAVVSLGVLVGVGLCRVVLVTQR